MVQVKEQRTEIAETKEIRYDTVPDIMAILYVLKQKEKFGISGGSELVRLNLKLLPVVDGTHTGQTHLIDYNVRIDQLADEIVRLSKDRMLFPRLKQNEVHAELEKMFKGTKKTRKTIEAFIALGEKF